MYRLVFKLPIGIIFVKTFSQQGGEPVERGRPRIFNEDQALDAALAVFWRNGYQGASMSELTDAMGISKPSLYAAFGNKEQLYLSALERYRDKHLARHAAVLAAEPDLRKAMRAFLRSVATMLTAPELPGGCMVVNSAVACDTSALPPRVAAAIIDIANPASFSLTRQRLMQGLQNKDLPANTSIEQLADYFATFMSGMSFMAKIGVSGDRLFETIEHALLALPKNSEKK
jgi:AcrR family transcriptional regulator